LRGQQARYDQEYGNLLIIIGIFRIVEQGLFQLQALKITISGSPPKQVVF
jgi:hypothetical protein